MQRETAVTTFKIPRVHALLPLVAAADVGVRSAQEDIALDNLLLETTCMHAAYSLLSLAVKWNKTDKKLLSAVDQGDTGMIRTLLLKGAVNPTKLDPEGTSSFHRAASRGAADCLDLMLTHGMDVNARDFEGELEKSWASAQLRLKTLISASITSRLDYSNALLAGLPHSTRRCTGLHLAVRNSQLDCVRRLLKYDAAVQETDLQGRTALHCAAISGCVSSGELLCAHGASADTLDNESRTPLMLAARLGRPEICRLLIARGAAINTTDSKHKSALILACESDCPEVAEILLTAGADVGLTDKSGSSARQYGLQSKNEQMRALLRASDTPIVSEPGHTDKNYGQEPTDVPESSTPRTPPAVSLPGLRSKGPVELELSAIGDRLEGDEREEEEEEEEESKVRQELARTISECNSLAEEYEGMKRQMNRRLRIFLQPGEEAGVSPTGDDRQGMDLMEVDLLLEILGQQLGALREDLDRTKKENRRLQEQVRRQSWERASAGAEADGSPAKPGADVKRLREEVDQLAEEKRLSERRFTELEGHLDNMRAVMGQYQSRKRSQGRQIEELEAQAAELAGHNEEYAALVRSLQEELEGRGPGDGARRQEAGLVALVHELREQKEDISRQKEELGREVKSLRGRMQADFVPLEVHHETTASWKNVVLHLQEATQEIERRLARLQVQEEQLRGENRRLRGRGREAELGTVAVAELEERARPRGAVSGLRGEPGEARSKLDKSGEGVKQQEAENVQAKDSLGQRRSQLTSFRIGEGAMGSSPSPVSDLRSELPAEQRDRDGDPRVGQNNDGRQEPDRVQASPSEPRVEGSGKGLAEEEAARSEEEEEEEDNERVTEEMNAPRGQLWTGPRSEARCRELEGSIEGLKAKISELTVGLAEAKREAHGLRRKSRAGRDEPRPLGQGVKTASRQEGEGTRAESSAVDRTSGLQRQAGDPEESYQMARKGEDLPQEANGQQREDLAALRQGLIPWQEHEDLKDSFRRERVEQQRLRGELVAEREALRGDLARLTSDAGQAEAEGRRLEVEGLRRQLEREASATAALRDRECQLLEEWEERRASLEARARGLGENLKRAADARDDARRELARAEGELAAERRQSVEKVGVADKQLEDLRLEYVQLEETLGDLQEEAKSYSESCFEKEEQFQEMMNDIERLEHEREKFQLQTECMEQRLKEAERQHEQVIAIYRAHLLSAAQGVMDQEVYWVLMRIWKMQQGQVLWREERGAELRSSAQHAELSHGKGSVLAEDQLG
uniref:ankyrin repeat domain-containing protein 35-like n=1 Tax=Pristiophorus japonicus TaxID=55135 RepID=UPI00398F0B4A